MRIEAWFNGIWYEGQPLPWWLRVPEWLYRAVNAVRRGLYRTGAFSSFHPGVPVIVVGNLVAGGAGKTPLVIALVQELVRQGFSPGVVSRGYGGRAGKTPLLINENVSVENAGDEPVMLARRTGIPVCVHPRRAKAARWLLQHGNVDLIICDDGLQHLALSRDLEIAVVDGQRGLGNGHLLPAGPLREPSKRLRRVDHVVINGTASARAKLSLPDALTQCSIMRLRPIALVNVASNERRAPDAMAGEGVAAVAGIGNPQRFFETLGSIGYSAECRAFPDHHRFAREELAFADGRPLLMTEKDAAKCREFAQADWWYLEVGAVLEPGFMADLLQQLARLRKN